jgi:hypothetical protein
MSDFLFWKAAGFGESADATAVPAKIQRLWG